MISPLKELGNSANCTGYLKKKNVKANILLKTHPSVPSRSSAITIQ